MRPQTKQKILRDLVTRIRTGTSFLTLNYLDHHKTPDSAWIRNVYILLSFYTELLLKAIYVYEGTHRSRKDLDRIFKFEQRHDLENIANYIGYSVLSKYGIYEVKRMRGKKYRFQTDVGNFYTYDFVDIRYDFIYGKVRTLKGDEHAMFNIQITTINRIAAILNGPAWA